MSLRCVASHPSGASTRRTVVGFRGVGLTATLEVYPRPGRAPALTRRCVALAQSQRISVDSVRAQSPTALAIPETTGEEDAALSARMCSRWPTFGDVAAGRPVRKYMCELHMGADRHRFTEGPPGLPVYEGRMVDRFDHRAKAYRSGRGRAGVWESLAWGDPAKAIVPQWYVPEDKLPDKVLDRIGRYRLGFCDVTAPRNERTLLAALIPPGVVCGHSCPTITLDAEDEWAYAVWLAIANSYWVDFLVRKKVALHVTLTAMDSLPFPRLALDDSLAARLGSLALRLTCTSAEMGDYWNAMAQHGWCDAIPADTPPPGLQDEESRALALAEIEALVAHHVFGLSRPEISGLLHTFPIVKRRDLERFGEFRTERLVLEALEAVGKAPCA